MVKWQIIVMIGGSRNENLFGNWRSWIYWIELHSLYVSQI